MQLSPRILFINLATIVGLLILAELTSRLVLHNIYNRSFDSAIIQDDKYKTSTGLYPGKTAKVWGEVFNTDNFGGRVNRKPFDKKKRTWLFIGDSVTQGVGVGDSSTYVSIISGGVDSVNVVNISMIGWTVSDYENALRVLLSDSTDDLDISRVTIGYCLNDVYGRTRSTELPVMGRRGVIATVSSFLQEHYATYKLLKMWWFRHANSYLQYEYEMYNSKQPYFNRTLDILQQIKAQCDTKEVALDVVVLPYRGLLSHQPDTKDALYSLVNNIIYELTMRNIPASSPQLKMKCNGNKEAAAYYLFADEIHFSPEGHKAVADFILHNKPATR